MKTLIFIALLSSPLAYSSVLPHVFYAPKKVQNEICQNSAFQNERFWKGLMSNRIEQLTNGKSETAKNSFITNSYQELFKKTDKMNGPKFMSYIYTNASNHLGRLVRFNEWPSGHVLESWDNSFVEGTTLRNLARTTNFMLAPKLMHHSLNLYKELSWSLGAASMCGLNYTKSIVQDRYLVNAFNSTDITGFVKSYVAFEQSFLQREMYVEFMIKIPTKSYVLDQMRYMPFNGQKHTNFAQWCENTNCSTSSYDLENRIRFDVWAILTELYLTKGNTAVLNDRLKNSQINETLSVFMK